jgi:hypothetical protein
MLKKSRTLAVSVAINISMQLCFVSVNGPRETYFVDSLVKHSVRQFTYYFISIRSHGNVFTERLHSRDRIAARALLQESARHRIVKIINS